VQLDVVAHTPAERAGRVLDYVESHSRPLSGRDHPAP
jgi:hypothetical protein